MVGSIDYVVAAETKQGIDLLLLYHDSSAGKAFKYVDPKIIQDQLQKEIGLGPLEIISNSASGPLGDFLGYHYTLVGLTKEQCRQFEEKGHGYYFPDAKYLSLGKTGKTENLMKKGHSPLADIHLTMQHRKKIEALLEGHGIMPYGKSTATG